jgi:aminoglycoside 6-adenylyltransferase
MRSEKEMLALILETAKSDDRIRAVYMNGSRANPRAEKDIFQDYDIVYVVTETASFIRDSHWIDVFGQRLIMQLPDECDKILGHPHDFSRCYGYLMQFGDGNRIDLHIQTLDLALEEMVADKLMVILLDKDHVLPQLPEPTDRDHWVKPPSQARFHVCCNEF